MAPESENVIFWFVCCVTDGDGVGEAALKMRLKKAKKMKTMDGVYGENDGADELPEPAAASPVHPFPCRLLHFH